MFICKGNRQVTVPDECSMINCLFHGFYTEESGGVLYLNDMEFHIDIYLCTFYLCVSYISGGALFFNNAANGKSSINMRNTCASTCFALSVDNNGAFANVQLKCYPICNMSFVSILKSSPHKTVTWGTVLISKANASIMNVNSSKNQCYIGSCFWIQSCDNTLINSCTFQGNSIEYGHNFYFGSSTGSRIIQNCNVIGNNGINYGVMSHQGNSQFLILNCVFTKNTEILFCNLWHSGYGGSGVLTVRSCYISHSGTIFSSWAGAPIYNEMNSFTTFPTYAHSHFNTFHCFAEIPNNVPITAHYALRLNSLYISMISLIM